MQALDGFFSEVAPETTIGESFLGDEYITQSTLDRAAFCFGRMSGHHRQIQQLIEQLLQLVCSDATFPNHEQGVVKGPLPIMAALFSLAASLPQVIGFLGNVQQTEIMVEDPNDLSGAFGVQIVQRFQQLLTSSGVIVAQDAGVSLL